VSSEDVITVTPPPAAPATPELTHPHLFRDVIETMLLIAIAFLVVNSLIGRFRIEQVSMEPNLHEGEYVIVDKVSYLFHAPERGDIVVLRRLGQPDLIKRLIGLPGETIEARGGQVYIDGQPLTEPYLPQSINQDTPPQTVPVDRYFVMGDNRNNSQDSRSFGTIPFGDIVGRAWIIYWPPPDWQVLARPGYAASP
jgi:signal peptidase I